MVFCSGCGKEIPSNTTVNFCPHCGKPVAIVESTADDLVSSRAISSSGKISRILGVIVGIWTFVFILAMIDYDFRLASVSESTSGLASLFVYRVAPSIEISNIIGLLFIAMSILLIVRPTRIRVVSSLILSSICLLLTIWEITQIPQILYGLFEVVIIGALFNVAVIIFSAAAYKKGGLIAS